jgi:hypothetical protein
MMEVFLVIIGKRFSNRLRGKNDELACNVVLLTCFYLVHGRELGTSVEEATLAGLGDLEPCQRLRLVAGFREFSDHIKEALREKVQATGNASYTITEADVHAILQGFRK